MKPTTANPQLVPLFVNTTDNQGGAGRAAYRIFQGLQRIGVQSKYLVFQKATENIMVRQLSSGIAVQEAKLAALLDELPLDWYRNRQKHQVWSLNWFPGALAGEINRVKSDLVHLHWIGNGFVPIQAFKKIHSPIVWTMHDMWAFTGGCHYAGDCTRYEHECGACPQLGSHRELDISRWTLRRKKRQWRKPDITLVAPSKWLADAARSSMLFENARIEVIHNGLDIERFRPHDPVMARDLLGLPQDKKLILFGALQSLIDRRKGVKLLQAAIHQNSEQWKGKAELVVFGASKPEKALDFGLPVHYMGHLHDDLSLAVLYSAADVMIVPSLQEAFGQTASEALACGTPVVAFGATGLLDIVEHQHNGYLAEPYEVDDLSAGINWVLEEDSRRSQLSANARETVLRKFDILDVARQYLALYQDILHP